MRRLATVVLAIVLTVIDSAVAQSPPTPITIGPEVVILATGSPRNALGFQFGPVDGVMGGVKVGPTQYRFFGSGESLNTSACPGSPGVQGVYAFSSDVSVSPPTFTTNCQALIQTSGPLVETGITGPFDRNYAGGGPAIRVTHPDGRRGVLLIYHAEVQWYSDGPCAAPGASLCFYGTLGMAFSADDGLTFQKLGLIIQAHISRATFHTPPYLGGNVPIGNGPFVLGDANGNAVDPRLADPNQTYIYVFYVDNQEDLGAADPCGAAKACLAVARAPLAAVIQAAFANTSVTGLFQKYFNGGFTEPAAPPDPNGTLPTNNAGRYTPILSGQFSPSAVYDAATRQVILATVSGGKIELRVSQNVLEWSPPAVATLVENSPPFNEVRYPSLIGELDDANIAGGQPWLFYSREPTGGSWPQTEFMVTRLQVDGPQLSVTAGVNQSTFTVGQTLTTSATLTSPGLPGAADLYVGALLPDGVTIVFWTGSATALGNRNNPASFRPYATNVALTPAFSHNMSDFFSRPWAVGDPHGNFLLFHLATKAGSLIGGAASPADILGLATAPFSLP